MSEALIITFVTIELVFLKYIDAKRSNPTKPTHVAKRWTQPNPWVNSIHVHL